MPLHITFNRILRAVVVPAPLFMLMLPARADLAPPPKDGLWRGIAGAALAATSGNTKTSSIVLNTDVVRATENDKFALGAVLNHARGTGEAGERVTTADKASAFGRTTATSRRAGSALAAWHTTAMH